MNHFVGIGRLTGGTELKYTAGGTPYVKFSICISKTWRDRNTGEKKEKAGFFNCVLWGKYGELMEKYLTKGKQIAIEAELEQNTWVDNGGQNHSSYVLNVNELVLLASPKGSKESGTDEPPPPDNGDGPYSDNVPF